MTTESWDSPFSRDRFAASLLRPSHLLLRNRVVLAAAVAIVTLQASLAAFGHELLLTVDRPTSRYLAEHLSYGFFRVVTEVGRPFAVLILAALVAVPLRHRCRSFAIALPVTAAVGVVLDVVIKNIVTRPRPGFGVSVGEAPSSFPSGHVMLGTIVLGLLVPIVYLLTDRRWAYRLALGLFVVYLPVVAVSRVVIGAHWLTDVTGSLLIGFTLLLFAEWLVGRRVGQDTCRCRIHRDPPPARSGDHA